MKLVLRSAYACLCSSGAVARPLDEAIAQMQRSSAVELTEGKLKPEEARYLAAITCLVDPTRLPEGKLTLKVRKCGKRAMEELQGNERVAIEDEGPERTKLRRKKVDAALAELLKREAALEERGAGGSGGKAKPPASRRASPLEEPQQKARQLTQEAKGGRSIYGND